MNDWAEKLALYVAAVAQLNDPLDEAQIRAAQDALTAVADEHYRLLAGALAGDLDAMKARQPAITARSLARARKGRR